MGRLALLPLALTLFTVVCFTVAYVWSTSNRDIGPPFLSATIDYPPVANFGALFLSISAALLCCIGVLRWRLSANHRFRCIRNTALVFCFLSAFFLAGVGAWQYHVQPVVHLTFAMAFFLCVNIYLVLMLRLDWTAPLVSKKLLMFRLLCTVLSAVTMVLTVVFIAQPTFLDKQISAGNEIGMVVLFLIHVATYAAELSKGRVTFLVESEEADFGALL